MNEYEPKPEPNDEEESFLNEVDSPDEIAPEDEASELSAETDDAEEIASLKQPPADEDAPEDHELVADPEKAPVDSIPGEATPGELVVDRAEASAGEVDIDEDPETGSDEDLFADADEDEAGEPDDPFDLAHYDNLDTGDPFVQGDDSIDIDAALASVASLSDYVAQREVEEAEEFARQEAEAEAEAEAARRREHYYFARPGLSTLYRGQITSFVPALLLMAFGAWLTFAFTATDTPPSAGLVVLVALAGVAIVFIVAWLGSGRWSRGSLFFGLTILLIGGVGLFLTQDDTLGMDGWPLFLSAFGAAGFLTAILSRGGGRAQAFTGIALILAGLAGLLVTTDTLDIAALNWVQTWGLLLLGVTVAVLLLLPLARGRRA